MSILLPSDYKLQSAMNKIFEDDTILANLTLKILRKKLEEYFKCDLIHKKDVIKRLLNKYIDDNIEMIEYNEKIRKEKLAILSTKVNVDKLNDVRKDEGKYCIYIYIYIYKL